MGIFSCLISQELRPTYNRMPFSYKLIFLVVNLSDRYLKWYKLPVFLGIAILGLRRLVHQKYNLIAVGPHDDGHDSGAEGAFIGRNMAPLSPNDIDLLDPHPAIVATKLLTRKQGEFADTGKQFNMLAASWINFMIHDWIDHEEDESSEQLDAPDSVAAQCPLKSFRFHLTKEHPLEGKVAIGFKNTRSSWWDASVIYGTNKAVEESVRSGRDGHLKIDSDGFLKAGLDDIFFTGDTRNPWMGVGVLQSLVIAEHNLVCETLKKAHPDFDDDALFTHAKYVVQAVLAKIHTIDWTVELLKMNTLYVGMRSNWYGLLGKWIKDHIGSTNISLLSGIIGAPKTVDHGVPYSMTDEFASVYRMHPMLPEEINIRDIRSPGNEPELTEKVPVEKLIGTEGLKKAREYGMKTLLTSMGFQACGALTLFNYPTWMRDLPVTDKDGAARPEHVDMPTLEIYRDRSRRVARYNQFRRSVMMPEIKSWKDLTDDANTIAAIREVYGENVENLDLLVGLLAEKKIPGYAISETAFYVFLLMATRRLEAYSRFTTEFNEETYTKEGLKWVNTTESLKDLLRRHHRDIVDSWMTSSSAFSVWNAPPEKCNPIPPLLRCP